LRECGVRVHDARIATFGERVEDFFRITDARNQPLSGEAETKLRDILLARVNAQLPAERAAPQKV
jgi:[protein-PII] uridylyltransferase